MAGVYRPNHVVSFCTSSSRPDGPGRGRGAALPPRPGLDEHEQNQADNVTGAASFLVPAERHRPCRPPQPHYAQLGADPSGPRERGGP